MSKEITKEAAASAAKAAVEAYGPPTRVILRVIFILLFVGALLWMLFKLTGIIPDYALKPHGGLTGTLIYWKRLREGVPA